MACSTSSEVGATEVSPAVDLHGLTHIVTDTDIVDDHTVFLAGIDSIDTADSLDQQMLFQRFVVIQISKARTSNPVIHISTTMTIWKLDFSCLNAASNSLERLSFFTPPR